MIIVMLGSTSFFDWVWLADVDTGLTSVTGSGSGLTSAGCLHTHFVANYFRSVKVCLYLTSVGSLPGSHYSETFFSTLS